jgi:lipid-A-disaccharide synthase-like uncharacterized protein
MTAGQSIGWIIIGFIGQGLFSLRFLFQWIASERKRQSVIPVVFWYFSLAGGMILLSYAIHKKDPVFIVGQSFGAFIYLRNLYFVYKHREHAAAA